MPFEGFDFTNFWSESDYAKEEYLSDPPTDALIAQIEEELGYKLPQSYVWLMRQHNGGFPVNTCFPCQEPTSGAEDYIEITGIMGIGREKTYSLCGELGSRFMIEEWGYPDIGVAFCECPSAGHDMVFFDYRECGPQGEPKVVHIDQEDDYRITFLAENFEEFIQGLVNEEVYDTSEEDKQEDLRTVREAPFSEMLTGLCNRCDNPLSTERWIRRLSEEIVQEKGLFGLHDDERSWLLYDIQFWLYTNAHPNPSEENYLDAYSGMIAMGGRGFFAVGGYAPCFVTDWLKQRIEEGAILKENGALRLAPSAKESLLAKRDSSSL